MIYRPRGAGVHEPLLRPDGSEVAVLTEAADRTWSRGLAPVVRELNRLLGEVMWADQQLAIDRERAEKAEAEVERLRAALEEIAGHLAIRTGACKFCYVTATEALAKNEQED